MSFAIAHIRFEQSRNLIFFALVLFVAACTTVVALKSGIEFLPPSPIQVPLTVGIYYSPELIAYEHSVNLSGGKRLIFPVGEATVRLLEKLSPTLFTRTVVLNTRPPLTATPTAVDAVLVPGIEAVSINFGPFVGRTNFYWAEIVYRCTVYSAKGSELASWKVRGIGERSGLQGDKNVFAETVELAMRDAAQKLQTSFFDVPEARRWVRGLATTDVNAPADLETESREAQALWGVYPNVAAATILDFAKDAQAPKVVSAKIRVRNESIRRLFVRPFDIILGLRSGKLLQPATASALVSAAASAYSRVPLSFEPAMTIGGPPVFAIATLVTSLINLATEEAENRQIETILTRYRTEWMRDTSLWESDSLEFIVHFVTGPETDIPEFVIVPVIDLDTSTRYLIRLPVD
jgi:hypothetical protein